MTRSSLLQGIFEKFEAPLLAYAIRLVGNYELAREAVQNAFLRLCEADAKAFENPKAWLYAVVRNRCVDLIRQQGRHHQFLAKSPEPEHSEVQKHFLYFEKVMSVLDEREQEVVRLRFCGELSYQEIGQVMELTESKVGVILHLALKKIRDHLQAEKEEVRNVAQK